MEQWVTYEASGVSYDQLDQFKRACQRAALTTGRNIERLFLAEVAESRGESVYLVELPDRYLAHVNEGLGTKILIADELSPLYYQKIAQDAVAMIVNDMITLGALPISVAMHLAAGDSAWFDNQARQSSLIQGWEAACHQAGCSWGGGETSVLNDLVKENTVVLSGSAIGQIKPKNQRITGNVQAGDAIILLLSSGVQSNGLTLARKIADTLPDRYETILPDKRTYGDSLLDPTVIYVPVVEGYLNYFLDPEIHYIVNITGHGWRKLMRLTEPFIYVIENLPALQPVFTFIQQAGPVDQKDMYGTFNMGAGMAIYAPPSHVKVIIEIAKLHGIEAMYAGHIEKRGNQKKVIIQANGIEFDGSNLAIR